MPEIDIHQDIHQHQGVQPHQDVRNVREDAHDDIRGVDREAGSLADRRFEKVNEILEKYECDKTALISILQEVQDQYRYLPREILTYVATALGLPPAKVYGVATFYAQFSLEPQGKYVIRACDGTACHVRGSQPVLRAIRDRLKLKDDERTTRDLMFTLETVSCLGACGLAPVVMINDKIHGQMTPEKVRKVLDDIIKAERKGEVQ